MLSLLNRICREIEDAWTAGFIQLFIIVILGYTVVVRVVADLEYVKETTRLENKYNSENGADHHVNGEGPPAFDLAESLLDNAPTLIVMAFVIGYEVRRRRMLRSRPAAQRDRAPETLQDKRREASPSRGLARQLLGFAGFVAAILIAGWIAGWVLRLLGYLFVRIYAWWHPELADFISHRQNSLIVAAMWAIVGGIAFLVFAVWLDVSLQKRRAKKG